MKRRVTLADVAKQAGVHTTTVSMALRNHPRLPEATRRRLRELAEKMGYAPDPAMQALAAYRKSIGPHASGLRLAYLTNWNTQWGWKQALGHGQFHLGASGRARELGYELEHFWLGEPGLSHERMSTILHTRGITGVIVASHTEENNVDLRLDWGKFCAVKIDFFPLATELHKVTNDQRAIIQLAMQRVVAAGYRRIGLVVPSWWDNGVRLAWSAGFLAMQQMLPEAERIPILNFPEESDLDRAQGEFAVRPASRATLGRWLVEHRPEVLISFLPFVKDTLDELGVVVPRDLAFVDVFLKDDSDGRVAGIRQNCQRVGELAVEILVGQLQQHSYGLPELPTITMVEGTWCDGDSLPRRIAANPA
jgi:LacI family transcriptional regulator